MTCFVWAAGFVVLGIAIWVTVFNLCFYSTATLLFFKIYLFIICKYAVAVFRHPRRGRQISLRIVVSHYVIAGIWTQDLQKSSQYSYPLSHLASPVSGILKFLFSLGLSKPFCALASDLRTLGVRALRSAAWCISLATGMRDLSLFLWLHRVLQLPSYSGGCWCHWKPQRSACFCSQSSFHSVLKTTNRQKAYPGDLWKKERPPNYPEKKQENKLFL